MMSKRSRVEHPFEALPPHPIYGPKGSRSGRLTKFWPTDPFPKIDVREKDGRWRLFANDVLTCEWAEADARGLGAWVMFMSFQLRGVSGVARIELGTQQKRILGGNNSGKERAARMDSKAAKVLSEIAKLVNARRDLRRLVPYIARKAACTEQYVREIMRARNSEER